MNDVSFRVLAESPQFLLGHSYESVSLITKSASHALALGDHYGDPKVGLITPDEQWFITAGEGLQCYPRQTGLRTFFRQECAPLEPQAPMRNWRVHGVRLESNRVVRVLIDPWSSQASIWRLDLKGQTLEKISDGPFLANEAYRESVEF